jgi:hypothetical protein
MRFLVASRVQMEVGVDLDPDGCPGLEREVSYPDASAQ